MVVQLGDELRHMMLVSEAAQLRERLETIGRELRERLESVARDLRDEADCEAFGLDDGLLSAM